MFLAELGVLEHITKPQRPNVFSEEFGLWFWPKTFKLAGCLFTLLLRTRKGEEKEEEENVVWWEVREAIRHDSALVTTSLPLMVPFLWSGLI